MSDDNLVTIPPPKGWGADAQQWLEAHGIVPRKRIPIRSSSLDLALRNPFGAYLRDILGIRNAFAYSDALSKGSWLHAHFEHMDKDEKTRNSITQDKLRKRLNELRTIAGAWGLGDSALQKFLDRETKDEAVARVWYDVAASLDIPDRSHQPPTNYKLAHYIYNKQHLVLGSEVLIVVTDAVAPNNPLVCVLDKLIYVKPTRQLWILDLKSTSKVPSVRLLTAKEEFQTQHYLYILRCALEQGLLHKAFPNLPPDISVAGMLHVAVQKCPLRFDKRVDRPYIDIEHVLQSGKRKGQIEIRREYTSDEPSYDLFLARCRDWYLGQGPYVTEEIERKLNPPVNISYSPITDVLDDNGLEQYTAKVDYLCSLYNRPPEPRLFIKNVAGLQYDDELADLSHFHLTHPALWPEVMAQNNLIQQFREEFINAQTKEGVHQGGFGPDSDPSALPLQADVRSDHRAEGSS